MNLKLYRVLYSLVLFVLTLGVSIGVSKKAVASHLAAVDLNLTYIGGGGDGCSGTTEYIYIITFDIYRACESNSAGAPSSATIFYESLNAGFSSSISMNSPDRDTVDQLCASFKPINSCRVRTNQQYPGYVLSRFQDTLILPSAQTDWRFWWSSCCRNGSIINLTSTGSMYIEAGLNNLTKYNNSTPRFTEPPLPYICVNQPSNYLNGPLDPNGDSMVTVVQEPLQGQNNPIAYSAPYTIANPLTSTAANFTFDNVTATARFVPDNQGMFVMAFRCDEYERGTGIPLGYIMRDVQVNVFQCASPPPAIDSLPTTFTNVSIVDINNEDVLIACPGSNIDFDISSVSSNPNSAVFMEANTSNIPGSVFTTTGGGTNSVTGNFTWTPTVNDVKEHTLIITTKDSTCSGTGFSIVFKNYTVLQLKVVLGLDAGEDKPICELNPDSVQLFVRGTDNLDINWSTIGGGPLYLSNENIHNPKALPPVTTSYIVEAPQLTGACKSKDTVVVFIDETNKVSITPKNPRQPEEALVMCNPGYLQLESIIEGRPPKNNVPCGTGNPTLCNNPDVATVYGSALFGKTVVDTIGRNAPIMYNTVRSTKQQFLIRNDEFDNAKMYSSTIRSISLETSGATNTTHVYSNFRISIKCTDKDSLVAGDGFENFGMTEVYYSPAVTFEDGVHEYQLSTPYTIDTNRNLIVQICYSDNPAIDTGCGVSSSPPVVRYVPTTYTSGLILAADNGATQNICGVDKSANISAVPARPAFTFSYCEADPLPFDIVWSQGPHLSDSTIANPLGYVPGSTRYVVQTIGRSGCLMRDTLDIYVPEHDYSISPVDTAICFGEETPIQGLGNGWRYWWYEYDNGQYIKDGEGVSCFECPTPTIKPSKTTDYRIVVSDSVFCYDTLNARIEVLPLPDVRILTEDTTVKYGKPFQILASGARLYNWTPVSSLNNPNISYPIAQPTEDTRYVLGGISANGCRAFDTLYVTIDDRDNLFVPSAFSPNGDGKNDMFKITNLTFQKVMEFRVFNRWGQEIFSTSDNGRGWDGTWKGVDQNIGTYSYLIRVGSPDGSVETYRGEVTLIR